MNAVPITTVPINTVPTFADLLLAQRASDHPAVLFEDQVITYAAFVEQATRIAALLRARLDPTRPAHVGVLLENTPDYLLWAGGAAIAGAAVVGINPTRRGAELARDIAHTDIQLIVTDAVGAPTLPTDHPVILVDDDGYPAMLDQFRGVQVTPPTDPTTPLFLLFTSGSTSAPKAVICATGRMAAAGLHCVTNFGFGPHDVAYCPMPLFHGNALLACWAPTVASGATVALRRKFSASGFLPDVRRYGCTFFTYVGRSIAYVLATPPSEVDRDHRLRLGFGTEASLRDRRVFAERFGCPLVESYGSSESVISIVRTPDSPEAALGLPNGAHLDVIIANPETMEECPRARFDEHGALVNAHDAIGEIVNRTGAGGFEGYYNNPDALTAKVRNGWYWSADLGYRDEAGFFYFAGRSGDWLRVDSENFASAPVETILHRFPDTVMVAVYPVPDVRTGDQVMATIEMDPAVPFDAEAFGAFLTAQPDLGTKWAPRYVRVTAAMPLTANNKVNKQPLRDEAWSCAEPVYWRAGRELVYRRLTDADRAALATEKAAHASGS